MADRQAILWKFQLKKMLSHFTDLFVTIILNTMVISSCF